ncbi:hypothetical protein [Pseudoduganella violaceinigra]|uniref:hypothetical protein n=1 Tax=Pseudoduganella violaceinigra TaxID=246602 RepID=UPI00040258A6|nr:hypothetical protein [Pseudoduganella violaceinigra]
MDTGLFSVGGAFVLVLLASNIARHLFMHHARARGTDMMSTDTAGWLLFVGVAFLGAAVIGVLNLSKFLNLAFCSTLLVFGVAALVGAFVIGRH